MNKVLGDLLKRAEKWPDSAQTELAQLADEIEHELGAGSYRASADELEAIDFADKSGVATEAEIVAGFARLRGRA